MNDAEYRRQLTITDERWQIPFIGRKVNDAFYETFDHNGCYPSNDADLYPDALLKGEIVNLKPAVTKAGTISHISYYKIVDHGLYYRGTDDIPLDSHDIQVFKDILEKCTCSDADEVITKLVEMPLPEGWLLKKVNDKSISLKHGEDTVSVPKDYLVQIINLANQYPDVIDNEDFWDVNKGRLRIKYKDPIMALLSNYNKANFPDLALNKTVREYRAIDAQREADRDLAIDLIKKGGIDKAAEIIRGFDEVPLEIVDVAIDNNIRPIIELLAEANVYYRSFDHIAHWCLENEEADLFKKLIEGRKTSYINDLIYDAYKCKNIECVKILLDKGCWIHIGDDRTYYPVKDLLEFTSYRDVIWPLEYIKDLYGLEDNSYLTSVIENIHHQEWDPDTGLNGPGYNNNEYDNIALWILETKDIELINFAVNRGIVLKDPYYNSQQYDAFLDAFETGGKYWENAKHMFNYDDPDYITQINKYCLEEGKTKLLIKLIKHFKCGVDFELLKDAIWDTKNVTLLKLLVSYYKVEDESEPKKLTSAIIDGGNTGCMSYYLSEFPYLVKNEETVEEARNSLLAESDAKRTRIFVDAGWFDETIFDEMKLAERCG